MVKLGQKVRDNLTGITGYCDHYADYMFSARRIGIQLPLKKDGSAGEAWACDETNVEILSEIPYLKVAPEPKQLHEFGQVVADPITNYIGTVIGRTVYINGCSRLLIQRKYAKNTDLKDAEWLEETRVIAVGKKVKKKPAVDNGGPQQSSRCSFNR